MQIVVIGLDYKATPASVREKVAFDTSKKKRAWGEHLLEKKHGEVVILSTCNRSEIYLATERVQEAIDDVKNVYLQLYGGPQIHSYLNVCTGREAVKHLFMVSAGFESMVTGEDQILGQVKDALEFAMVSKQSGKMINKLFRESITFSKMIRNRYGLSENPVSTCYAGIRLLKDMGRGLEGKKVLITGAGNMGALALRHVLAENPKSVTMTNRRHDRLISFLEDYQHVIPVAYENRYHALNEADVLISATASPHVVFSRDKMMPRNKPLIILDFAIPRDVDLDIGQMEGIKLLDIDDLKQVVDENLQSRKEIVSKCMIQLEKEVDDCMHWMKSAKLDPLLDYVNRRCDEIHRNTIRYLEQNTSLTQKELEEVGYLLSGHLKQSFKKPIIQLKKPNSSLHASTRPEMSSLIQGLTEKGGY